MSRLDRESTARISRDELSGLLDTMSPFETQPITARTSIKAVEAALERQKTAPLEPVRHFTEENWDEILTAAVVPAGSPASFPRATPLPLPLPVPLPALAETAVPVVRFVSMRATPQAAPRVVVEAPPRRWPVIAASFVTTFIVGLCAVYFVS